MNRIVNAEHMIRKVATSSAISCTCWMAGVSCAPKFTVAAKDRRTVALAFNLGVELSSGVSLKESILTYKTVVVRNLGYDAVFVHQIKQNAVIKGSKVT